MPGRQNLVIHFPLIPLAGVPTPFLRTSTFLRTGGTFARETKSYSGLGLVLVFENRWLSRYFYSRFIDNKARSFHNKACHLAEKRWRERGV